MTLWAWNFSRKEFRSCPQVEMEPSRSEQNHLRGRSPRLEEKTRQFKKSSSPHTDILWMKCRRCCRVQGSIIKDEPRDAELLWEGELSDLLRKRRCAEIVSLKGVVPVWGDASDLHILVNGLLDLLVQPLLQVVLVFRLLALLLGSFMQMVAAGAFFVVDPITPLVIEDVPQILLDRWRSLAVLGWRTRSMAASGGWTRSLPSIPELPLNLTDELVLLLDDKVLGPDIC